MTISTTRNKFESHRLRTLALDKSLWTDKQEDQEKPLLYVKSLLGIISFECHKSSGDRDCHPLYVDDKAEGCETSDFFAGGQLVEDEMRKLGF